MKFKTENKNFEGVSGSLYLQTRMDKKSSHFSNKSYGGNQDKVNGKYF